MTVLCVQMVCAVLVQPLVFLTQDTSVATANRMSELELHKPFAHIKLS